VALDLSEPARAALARWRDEAVAGRDDLRAVVPNALHVTLAFLGYRPEKEIPLIAQVAAEAVEGLPPARLVPAGVKPVPPRRPRLFALDLEEPAGECTAVQSAISEALAGRRLYRPEKRPFWPHVTLARVKRGLRADPLRTEPPAAEELLADRVTLYRSTLLPQGARYDPLESVTLPVSR
jgi:RNA 2',3'-cyclic 3'-phosphodiesterase